MGKLVLYFPDGSTRDILLTKERTTIGRRPDNDVPLPSAAVSAEHAAVVTVLDDSFLEDLGSTNGTFVNEKPVTKHFLRDRDRLDVGREIMVYYADDGAEPDELPADLFRHPTDNLLAPLDAHLAALDDLTKNRGRKIGSASNAPRPVVAEYDPQSIGAMTGQVATEFDAQAPAGSDADTTLRVRVRDGAAGAPLALVSKPPDVMSADAAADASAPLPSPELFVQVVDGPNAGREIALDKAETLVGRVGLEVVALRRSGEQIALVRIEGPALSGDSPAIPDRDLRVGETFSAAGTTLRLAAR